MNFFLVQGGGRGEEDGSENRVSISLLQWVGGYEYILLMLLDWAPCLARIHRCALGYYIYIVSAGRCDELQDRDPPLPLHTMTFLRDISTHHSSSST